VSASDRLASGVNVGFQRRLAKVHRSGSAVAPTAVLLFDDNREGPTRCVRKFCLLQLLERLVESDRFPTAGTVDFKGNTLIIIDLEIGSKFEKGGWWARLRVLLVPPLRKLSKPDSFLVNEELKQ